mmetsp:Transcript_26636/g.45240  ORF Transcript_26636/g.45240 Transcript_26636/m.45240 type:complete len:204 (-) Transcript_26636:1493-2104(-)
MAGVIVVLHDLAPFHACLDPSPGPPSPCHTAFLSVCSLHLADSGHRLSPKAASDVLRALSFRFSLSSSSTRFSKRCIGSVKRKNRECAACTYFTASSASSQRSKRQNCHSSLRSLYPLRKCTISSFMCLGTTSMPSHSFIRGSDLGTPMTLRSGPISLMHSAAPTIRISTPQRLCRGSVDRIKTSTGFPSSATVCGMKPALAG